jgi:DNA-binding CsgD family transcriptional regulator
MRFNIADAHVSALLLSGRVKDATDVAQGMRDQAADLPGTARLLASAVSGRAALGAGQLDTACLLLKQAAEALSASGFAIGWGFRYHVPYATALAIRGSTSEATATLVVLDKVGRPFRSLDYERSLARAWCAAGQGAVSEAVAILVSAAERAGANGQFAAEVICLQTAAQFGHRSGGPRLRELEGIVEGPRVGLAARFAEALRDADSAELATVSMDFERMGDLVAAADAAAHAAISYRRRGLRGSALQCSTRADELAQQCGGPSTPALRQGSERLPLTDREREIVMLIADGLSSRAVAERLTLSVRTVESHIYRAMLKTGTESREELTKLLPRHKPRTQ